MPSFLGWRRGRWGILITGFCFFFKSPQLARQVSTIPWMKFTAAVKLLSRVWFLVTPWTICSLPGSSIHGIFRQEYRSGLPLPSPRDLPNPGIELGSPTLQADSLPFEPPGNPVNLQMALNPGLHVIEASFLEPEAAMKAITLCLLLFVKTLKSTWVPQVSHHQRFTTVTGSHSHSQIAPNGEGWPTHPPTHS